MIGSWRSAQSFSARLRSASLFAAHPSAVWFAASRWCTSAGGPSRNPIGSARTAVAPDRSGTARRQDLWAYVPSDTSSATLRAIVTHPSVIDTDGINRRAFTIADAPPLTPRRGGLFDGAPAWMARGARALAYGLAGIAVRSLLGAAVLRLRSSSSGESASRAYAVRTRQFNGPYTFTARSRETLAVLAVSRSRGVEVPDLHRFQQRSLRPSRDGAAGADGRPARFATSQIPAGR